MTVYSHSRLSSFEKCPLKFRYRYIDKVPVETEGIEAFMGKRAHEILERLYHHVARYGKPPSLAQVLARFRTDWQQAWHDKVQIVRTENDVAFYQERGAHCLENYYRAHYPFEDGETVAIEAMLQLSLDPDERYKLVGIVDRIVRRGPGRYEIHDYKTGNWLPKQAELDSERQLALYQIGLEQTYDDVEEVDLVWHYLAHGKELRSRREPKQLGELREQTISLIDEIEACEAFEPKPSALCRWCEYGPLCPKGPRQAPATAAAPHPADLEPSAPQRPAPTPPATRTQVGPSAAADGEQLSLLDRMA